MLWIWNCSNVLCIRGRNLYKLKMINYWEQYRARSLQSDQVLYCRLNVSNFHLDNQKFDNGQFQKWNLYIYEVQQVNSKWCLVICVLVDKTLGFIAFRFVVIIFCSSLWRFSYRHSFLYYWLVISRDSCLKLTVDKTKNIVVYMY
jgi:hypothetical protein